MPTHRPQFVGLLTADVHDAPEAPSAKDPLSPNANRESRTVGFMGRQVVNVVELNHDLPAVKVK